MNYPYTVFATDEVTRTGSNTYTYANSKLIFATKTSGSWATVIVEPHERPQTTERRMRRTSDGG